MTNLHCRISRMSLFNPLFVSVTWGAGGSTAQSTLELASACQNEHELTTMLHLTCTNMNQNILDDTLKRAKDARIRNILALRGDPPRGSESQVDCPSYKYAVDLVRYIRRKYGEWFCIAVAGYPEGHLEGSLPQSQDPKIHLPILIEKIKAGADLIITQIFYDIQNLLSYEKMLREHESGLFTQIPIIPAIMPIQSYQSFKRLTKLCHLQIPPSLSEKIELAKKDDQVIKDIGVEVAVNFVKTIQSQTKQRCQGFHFCTLNLEKSVAFVIEESGLLESVQKYRDSTSAIDDSAFEPSVISRRTRRTTSVISNPHNRVIVEEITQSLLNVDLVTSTTDAATLSNVEPPSSVALSVSEGEGTMGRQATWDEFTNGRFGDARSPAFGDIGRYGISLQLPSGEALQFWGHPVTADDIGNIFCSYLTGKIPAIPWSELELSPETGTIRDHLLRLNERGWWTLSSQPAISSISSDDPIFGWGPSGGWVYQKAFVEFFIDQKDWYTLLSQLKDSELFTFYAGNNAGEFLTNAGESASNAVMWGVFPGKEIIQPTIIEEMAFKTWKVNDSWIWPTKQDEAFAIFGLWRQLYSPKSLTVNLLTEMIETRWLVCVISHDYMDPQALWEFLNPKVSSKNQDTSFVNFENS